MLMPKLAISPCWDSKCRKHLRVDGTFLILSGLGIKDGKDGLGGGIN